ncbi:MAG: hypothetical protein GEU80_16550 [Dehalococcoidia bacterium]|nr:hypothetical protein [Dehalococcoidia bacterium]
MSLENVRDVVIIVYGVMGIFLLVVLSIATIGLWIAVRALTKGVATLVEDPIRPTLDEVRKTVENMRGTSEFVSDTAVSPLIKVVAVARGVRRGASSLASTRRRGR